MMLESRTRKSEAYEAVLELVAEALDRRAGR